MNQVFKKKVIAASLSSVFAFGAAASIANVFEASVPNNYSTQTVVLKTGSSVPKWLNNGTTNSSASVPGTGLLGISESGTWNSSSTAPIAIRETLPAGVEIWGSQVISSTAATASLVNTGTNVSALMTAGTAYDIRKTVDAGAVGSKYAFAYVDLTGSDTFAEGTAKQFAVFGLAGTGATSPAAIIPTSLKAGASTSTATVYTGQGAGNTPVVAAAATMDALTGPTVWVRKTDGSVVGTANDKIGKITKNADGTTTIVLYVSAPDATAGNDQLILPSLPVTANATATTGNASVTVSDGPSDGSASVLGITTTTVTAASVTSNLVSIAGSATGVTPPVIPVGATAAQYMGNLKITFADTATTAADSYIYVTLNNGAKFKAGVTGAATSFATAISANNTSNRIVTADSQVSVNASGQLVIQVNNTAVNGTAIAAGDSLTLAANSSVIDTNAATAGTITATVTGAGTGMGSFGTQSVTVATTAAKGVTTSFVDAGAVGYTKLFTGRDTVALTTGEGLKLVEAAFGSIPTGGEVTMTLDRGAKFDNGVAVTSTGTPPLTFTAPSTATATVTGTAGTATLTGASGTNTLTGFQFDLQSATSGDLNVTFSGTGGVTGTIKLAELTDATSMSVGGALPTPAVSTSGVALPTITITETAAGALVGAAQLDLVLDNGATWSTATGVTATASGGNGTLTSATIATTTTANDTMRFTSAASASAATSFAIAGLKVNTGTVSGAVKVTPQGTALPAKTAVQVANVVPATVLLAPPATVTGTVSSQTVTASMVPAGNDQGKQGKVFVAAVLPSSLGGGVYFMKNDQSWVQFTSCATAPAYSSGSLAAVPSIAVANAMDVSSLIGTQIYVGYGIGGALSAADAACNYMLVNGSYNLSYTVAK